MVHTDFGGNSYGPIIGPYLYGPMVLKVLLGVSPYNGIGPWMALPSFKLPLEKRHGAKGSIAAIVRPIAVLTRHSAIHAPPQAKLQVVLAWGALRL